MRMAELGSTVPNTGTEHAPANDSGPEQAPATSTPPPGSTTHRFTTREGNEAYRAQTRLDSDSTHGPRVEDHSSAASHTQDPDNEIDQTVNFVSLMVQEARDASKGLSAENNILAWMGAKMPPPEPYSGEPDLEQYQAFIAGLLQWFLMNQLLGSDTESTLMQLKCLGNCLQVVMPPTRLSSTHLKSCGFDSAFFLKNRESKPIHRLSARFSSTFDLSCGFDKSRS